MNIIAWISLVILALYILKILKFKYNWEHYPEFKPPDFGCTTGISVIIAFRNEISNLPALLTALKEQEYPASLYEVILVNDHSDDGSDILVQNFCTDRPNFRLVQNDKEVAGKKSALRKGIAHASFELIVTSDADCTMKPRWMSTLALYYQEKHPDMIIGLVSSKTGSGIFGAFQDVEFLSLVAAGAGAAAGNNPIYCNGACLAYRKSLFLAYPDPLHEELASGDDTLFMLTVKKNRRQGIILLKAFPAVVITQGAVTWHNFIQQRKRWISKSLYYRDLNTVYTALLVFLVCLSVLYALAVFAGGFTYWLFPVMYTGKLLTDLYFLSIFFHYFQKKLSVMRFMLFELVYPFYAVIFAIAGISTGFSWKGRRFG